MYISAKCGTSPLAYSLMKYLGAVPSMMTFVPSAAIAAASSANNAQYSSPYYYSALHQASVRQHYNRNGSGNENELSNEYKSQNGLRVDWSVHTDYEKKYLAPKWVLTAKWDRPELTRAREFGGR